MIRVNEYNIWKHTQAYIFKGKKKENLASIFTRKVPHLPAKNCTGSLIMNTLITYLKIILLLRNIFSVLIPGTSVSCVIFFPITNEKVRLREVKCAFEYFRVSKEARHKPARVL